MVKAKANKSTEYFLAGPTYWTVTKGRVLNQHSRYINTADDVFNGIGCFEGTYIFAAQARQQTILGTAEMHGIHIVETISG